MSRSAPPGYPSGTLTRECRHVHADGRGPFLDGLLDFPGVTVFVVPAAGGAGVVGFALGSVASAGLLAHIGYPASTGIAAGDYHLTWRAVRPADRGHGAGGR